LAYLLTVLLTDIVTCLLSSLTGCFRGVQHVHCVMH